MDLPPPIPPPFVQPAHVTTADPQVPVAAAPGDLYPRTPREKRLCDDASHPDWAYLGALLALDAGAIYVGSTEDIKYADSLPVRMTGPFMIGITWGATVGGAWLALPKCSSTWIDEPPREGSAHEDWPLALSLALLGGATAPIVNAIAIGYTLPQNWTTEEREAHIVLAGLAGFGGALLPYVLPPRTWRAARELERLRFGVDDKGTAFVGYSATF